LSIAASIADVPVERVTLQAAIERALARNPSVAVAREEVRRSEALVRQVRSGALPQLYGYGAYTRFDDNRNAASNGKNQLAGSLQLTLPLVNAQRWVQWSHADDNVRVAEISSVEVRRQIAIAVARTYLAVVTSHRVLEVNERARTTAEAHLDFAATRLRGGVGNKLDEVRAGQELATVVAQLEASRASLARAQEGLGVIVAAEHPLDSAGDPQFPETGDVASALDAAETQRTDIRALRERKGAADRVVRDSWADYMPLLNAVATPFLASPAGLIQPEKGWSAQLLLTLPLYDGGLRYGLQDERRSLATEARDTLDGAIRQARAEVRGAFVAMLRADDALRAARDGARLAQQALELASLAYRAGAVTNLEVIDAERRARDAETTAALAEDFARQARLDLLTASGKFP
jgi:outer membrane protein TolC